MFAPTKVVATLPAQDMERAKSFYADRLGIKPTDESEDGVTYEIAGSTFFLFPSSGKPSGDHTQMSFEVSDLVATVKELRGNGVVFEEYDMPGFKSVDGIVQLGTEKGAWFKDSEGNLIAIAENLTGR